MFNLSRNREEAGVTGNRNTEKYNKKVMLRYALFQLPAILIIILIYSLLTLFFKIERIILVYVLCGWIIKDIVIYSYVWKAYRIEKNAGFDSKLVGKTGVVIKRLQPEGYIKINGELWKATVTTQTLVIPEGRKVIIQKVDGLMVWVIPETKNVY